MKHIFNGEWQQFFWACTGTIILATGCGDRGKNLNAPKKPTVKISEQASVDSLATLTRYNFSDESLLIVQLPPELNEISGLAATDDGMLLVHDNEWGVIYEVDPTTSTVIKHLPLGPEKVRGD